MKANFSALFKAPVNQYKFFFIYGNDIVVFERIIYFLHKKFPCPIEIKSEKDFLTETSLQRSLFDEHSQKSLTLVQNVTDKIINSLDKAQEGIFIFTSEKARSQSKLVTHFSCSPDALAIAAYASPLTTSEFDFLIGDLNLPVSFKGQLFKSYQNDYMGLLATLEKIKLYGDVPESAYASFLESHATLDDFHPFLHPFLLKNQQKLLEILYTLNSTDLITVLRSLLRSFQILHELMPFKNRPESITWQKLSSPVFFKDQPIYQSALSRWSKDQVLIFLESLLKLEYRIKYERLTPSQINQKLIDSMAF